ncbi:MAG: hypothetical protein CL927_19750 [Deltaproteobacteria bacterium]|nr:hypothetical protein [Deltaproteobacteria bacterium]HCH66625.1 hypothetical protein [Deltaproteobacteria bacterium]
MDRFARSWQIAKLSFGVIRKDKEMLAFPLLAGIFSLLFMLVLLFPTILVQLLGQAGLGAVTFGVVEYAALFVSYLGLSFIATFFNMCVVYTSKVRFSGGDATFMDSIRFSLSRVGPIFAWSMLAATVGIFLRLLDHVASRLGGVGKILLSVFRALLGMIWSIVVTFVVPAMVYDNLGPVDAIKKSAQTIQATWGESLIRHYGLGFVGFLFMFGGILLSIGLFSGLSLAGPPGVVVAIVISTLYFLATFLLFNCANTVFNTALYVYASEGQVPDDFDSVLLEGAFRGKRGETGGVW